VTAFMKGLNDGLYVVGILLSVSGCALMVSTLITAFKMFMCWLDGKEDE